MVQGESNATKKYRSSVYVVQVCIPLFIRILTAIYARTYQCNSAASGSSNSHTVTAMYVCYVRTYLGVTVLLPVGVTVLLPVLLLVPIGVTVLRVMVLLPVLPIGVTVLLPVVVTVISVDR